jgi:hypothetical protein
MQRRSFLGIPVSLAFLSVCAAADRVDFKVVLKVDKKTVAEMNLTIEGDSAIVRVEEETERYDLKDMSWLDEETGRRITIAQAKEWAAQSKAKALKNLDSAPADIRQFLSWSLEPTFKVSKSENVLRLTSGQVDYVIEGEASRASVDGYYRYAVLNSYRKAMTLKKAPPFAELKALEEMKALGRIPQRMSVTMPGVPKAPAFDIEIRETKQSGGR